MPLLTSALSYTTHPAGLRSHTGLHIDHLPLRLASSQKSKRRCNLSLRSRAERINDQLGHEQPIPKRDWFDDKFVFGAATSAYQIEGAWNEEGKGPSNWDHYCHNHPERIFDNSNGDIAINSYHQYGDDARMLKEMGMKAYRFSISWSRILPKGTLEGGINDKGIQYYKNLIKLLKDNSIEPYVTIFHWDTPQALEDKYGGFLSPRIVKDYTDFAKVCFENFGTEVKNWFTFNEPHTFCTNSYGDGLHAPGRCSPEHDCAIQWGDSLSEPYRVGHHLLLAHAEVANLYKNNYKGKDGRIGMALDIMCYEPFNEKKFLDEQAQQRSIDFHLGWFMEPVFRGDYPFSMRSLVGNRLPCFTDDEKKKLQDSYDMMGLNYYTSRFAEHIDLSPGSAPKLSSEDVYAEIKMERHDGIPIGPDTGSYFIRLYPKGLKDVLKIMKEKYGNPPIFITENGTADYDDGSLPMEKALNDSTRIHYLQCHISAIKESIDSGSNVVGHFTWSLLDNFEWSRGYTLRFGLIYVDRKNCFKRHMKESAKWFQKFNGKTSDDEKHDKAPATPDLVLDLNVDN